MLQHQKIFCPCGVALEYEYIPDYVQPVGCKTMPLQFIEFLGGKRLFNDLCFYAPEILKGVFQYDRLRYLWRNFSLPAPPFHSYAAGILPQLLVLIPY